MKNHYIGKSLLENDLLGDDEVDQYKCIHFNKQKKYIYIESPCYGYE